VPFTRLVEDDATARLQTPLIHYRNAKGVAVDLVGAIHLADKSYFEDLQKRLAAYDAVLYEDVRSPTPASAEKPGSKSMLDDLKALGKAAGKMGEPLKPGQKQGDADAGKLLDLLGPGYQIMRRALGMEFQVDAIDYTRKNFVHADMTAAQFREISGKLNLSLSDIVKKGKGEHPAPTFSAADLIGSMAGQESSRVRFKLSLAKSFSTMGAGSFNDRMAEVLITERNKVALQQLDRSLQQGRKSVALFFGSGHLPGMDAWLTGHGFERMGMEWLTAWDIPKPVISK
jgi:hypothetical protein